MKDKSTSGISKGMLARWPLFSSFGLTAGIALALTVADPVEKLVGMMLVTPIMFVAAGTVFGGSQWLAVWRSHRRGLAWIIATGISVGVGMTLGLVVVETVGRAITGEPMRFFSATAIERTIGLSVIGLLTGLAVGLSQWIVMRRHLRGLYWVLISAFAFMVGFPVGAIAASLLTGLQGIAGLVLFLSISGFIVGMITAWPARRMEQSLVKPETP